MNQIESTDLRSQWNDLKTENHHLRIRNAARELGVSEVELLATQCGENVTRLKADFKEILREVEGLGKVMALTRNNSVVHERKGVYKNPSLTPAPVGLFVGEDIDLRIFFQSWNSGFAVNEMARGKERKSLQFFAKNGEAVHKIYLTEDSIPEAFNALVEKYRHSSQEPTEVVERTIPPTEITPDSEIDIPSFRQAWLDLKDTHDFFQLLRKYSLSRTQALRLAPKGNYALKLQPEALRNTISKAAANDTPIMVFVGNQGMIQIHTGPVKRLLDHEGWFNVMDPDFNLHIKEADIAEAWVVRKPSKDGIITAIECFDQAGQQIVQVFGKRKPGIPELKEWRTIVAEVEQEQAL